MVGLNCLKSSSRSGSQQSVSFCQACLFFRNLTIRYRRVVSPSEILIDFTTLMEIM